MTKNLIDTCLHISVKKNKKQKKTITAERKSLYKDKVSSSFVHPYSPWHVFLNVSD